MASPPNRNWTLSIVEMAIFLRDIIPGTLIDKSQATEAILDPTQNKSGVVNPFNAYSKSGDPEVMKTSNCICASVYKGVRYLQGEIVYVNYGTIDDFIHIDQIINLTNKICMARYGKIFRGDKCVDFL